MPQHFIEKFSALAPQRPDRQLHDPRHVPLADPIGLLRPTRQLPTRTGSSSFLRRSPPGDLPVQAQVHHQPLQSSYLFPQLPQLTQFANFNPGLFPFPEIVGRLADPRLAAYVVHSLSRFHLPQYRQDPLLRMSLLGHRPRLLSRTPTVAYL